MYFQLTRIACRCIDDCRTIAEQLRKFEGEEKWTYAPL
ncbi:hypothetical protein SS05631_c11670 [Sinorhizobium sp. CCBAU 05631]|nr:hypothetical protein SS05631_c11670 [Sinorhizobium sp. CCBAU 05631]